MYIYIYTYVYVILFIFFLVTLVQAVDNRRQEILTSEVAIVRLLRNEIASLYIVTGLV